MTLPTSSVFANILPAIVHLGTLHLAKHMYTPVDPVHLANTEEVQQEISKSTRPQHPSSVQRAVARLSAERLQVSQSLWDMKLRERADGSMLQITHRDEHSRCSNVPHTSPYNRQSVSGVQSLTRSFLPITLPALQFPVTKHASAEPRICGSVWAAYPSRLISN